MTDASTEQDREWLRTAVDLSRQCPPSYTAFSVGAVIVDEHGNELSRGYSRETDDHVHAEESALSKLSANDPRLKTATLYSSLEPCTKRRSRPKTCTQLILEAGIPRVVIAWKEPPTFVIDAHGAEALTAAGITVITLPELAEAARSVNAHLVDRRGS
ncbi:dCMP deaminase [Nonomuraea sp. B19D2]|uniref:dCMP deaminase n=1 Tax=Nonomuraea sp. B19D2 TaxID=3159561 RepID=UPI0032DA74C9